MIKIMYFLFDFLKTNYLNKSYVMLHIGVCGIHVELFNLTNVIKISYLDQCFVLWKFFAKCE
jgi:hypothetical protein